LFSKRALQETLFPELGEGQKVAGTKLMINVTVTALYERKRAAAKKVSHFLSTFAL
jgi:hypothetical protein